MAEAPRPRPVEYYNPRPLILSVCFFWGIAMGFCLFYFSPPKQMMGPENNRNPDEQLVPKTQMTDQERRRIDTPEIAPVEPAPQGTMAGNLPRFETMTIDPPAPVITTEGGLTGRTAQPLTQQTSRPISAPTQQMRPPPVMTAPPPIPELMF